MQHLSDEFQEVVRDRQSFLGRALGKLQFHRELSSLQLLHIQVLTLWTWPERSEFPSLTGASQRSSQNRFTKWGAGVQK